MSEKIPTNQVTDVVKNWVKPQIHQFADGSVKIIETGNTKNGTYRDQAYGAHWQGKAWGRVGEFVFKTGASLMGEGWLATGTKIALKSTGTAFKYIGEGEDVGYAFKTGLIVNAATPSNYGHLFKHGNGGLVGKALGEYSDVIKGTPNQPGLTFNPATFQLKLFGEMRTVRPWTTEFGGVTIEMNTVGYGVYNTLYSGHGGGHGSEHGTTGAEATQLGQAKTDLHTGAGQGQSMYINNPNDTRNPLERKMDDFVLNGKDETFIALFNQGFKDKAYEYWEAKHNKTLAQYIQTITLQKEITAGIGIVQHKLDDFTNWNASTMVANEEYIRGLSNGTIVAYSGDPLLNSVAVFGKTALAGANWAASAVFGTAGKAASTIWSLGGGITQGIIDIPNDVTTAMYDIVNTERNAQPQQTANAVVSVINFLYGGKYAKPKSIMIIGDNGNPKEVLVRDIKKSENQIAEEGINKQLNERNNLQKLVSEDYRNKVKAQSKTQQSNIITDKKQIAALKQFINSAQSKSK
jgi:hypothetical protein